MRPQHTKKHLRKISPPDYNYGGFWDGLYHFIKGDYKTGFTEIAVCVLTCLATAKED